MESRTFRNLSALLNFLSKMDKSEIHRLANLVSELENESLDEYPSPSSNLARLSESEDTEKRKLIGMLPFILMDEKYFASRADLVKFATEYLKLKLNINANRTREQIIGSIIVGVYAKEPSQIHLITNALESILGKEKKGKISNFFLEWDKVIRES